MSASYDRRRVVIDFHPARARRERFQAQIWVLDRLWVQLHARHADRALRDAVRWVGSDLTFNRRHVRSLGAQAAAAGTATILYREAL